MPAFGKRTLGTIGLMGGIHSNHVEFTWSLAQMLQYTNEYVCAPGEIVHLVKADLSFHAAARNQMVKEMLGDWLLQLDMDHAFAPDFLARMLYVMNTYELDVLTGMYHYRLAPFGPEVYYWSDKHAGFKQIADWDKKATIFRIDSAGGGCLLVRRSVYDRIYKELKEEPFSITPPFSEDHSFFVRLKKLGIKSFCAPKIQYAHLMTKPITSEDYVDRRSPWDIPIEVSGA